MEELEMRLSHDHGRFVSIKRLLFMNSLKGEQIKKRRSFGAVEEEIDEMQMIGNEHVVERSFSTESPMKRMRML